MVGGNMLFKRELIEQRSLFDLPMSHHDLQPCQLDRLNHSFFTRRDGASQDHENASIARSIDLDEVCPGVCGSLRGPQKTTRPPRWTSRHNVTHRSLRVTPFHGPEPS